MLSIFQGDSGDIFTIRPNIKDAFEVISNDWVCRTRLIGVDGTEYVAPRIESTLSDDGLLWIITLSPDDTLTVPVAKNFTSCIWVIQVSNNALSPIYNREQHVKVNIKKQGLIP